MPISDDLRLQIAADLEATTDAPELMPSVLARACVKVLPAEGASLSLVSEHFAHPDLRVPLGFSDPVAGRIERLQTTHGDGPCLTAATQGVALWADEPTIAARWPTFHHDLVRQTPVRSIASLPIRPAHPGMKAALNLYFTPTHLRREDDPARADGPAGRALTDRTGLKPSPDLTDLHSTGGAISDVIADLLFEPSAMNSGVPNWPAWLTGASATRRLDVWIAVGMLSEHSRLPSRDALAVLRGYAYTQQRSLDWIADQLINRRLTSATVMSAD